MKCVENDYSKQMTVQKELMRNSQKHGRLRQPLQKFSSLYKAELVYEGRLKVIFLLQLSSYIWLWTYPYYFGSDL